jgi:hypothetical protein
MGRTESGFQGAKGGFWQACKPERRDATRKSDLRVFG